MSSALYVDEQSGQGTDEELQGLIKQGQELINAILEGKPLEKIRELIDQGAPLWYQDEEEGISALHAAAHREGEALIRLLIESGAVWNAADNLQNTAGDVSLSLNNDACYTIIRDAGIRSELLLSLLASRPSPESPTTLVLRTIDSTAAGSPDAFLSSHLHFTKNEQGQEICLVKAGDDEIGVMMGWEKGIMQKTVEKLCLDHENAKQGLKILNVGFGLGIIDTLFQSLPTLPSHHIIVEPHPDVLHHMKELGWYERKNVTVLEGRWQDFVEDERLLSVGGFDVIYTDTFSEEYKDLRQFFGYLPDLLAGPESRFSFFNGLGATNALFYDVYTHLSELHLADVGITNIDWSDVDVARGEDEDRWGQTRQYFSMPLYRLPICSMGVA